MSADYVSNLEDEICRLIQGIDPFPEPFTLTCNVDGTASVIPGGFMNAFYCLDGGDFMAERFHMLVAELGFIVTRDSGKTLRALHFHIQSADIRFQYDLA
ncbi:MAG: hypothetical protein AAF514_16925 [Verrucomicrobiota bacterium]